MKKNEVKVGRYYTAKVSDKMCTVRIDAENPRGGWDATNLRTGKAVRIKSAQRLRGGARGPGKKMDAKQAQAIHAADQANARKAEQRAKSPDGQTASERAMADSAEDAARAKKASKASGKAKASTKRDTGERRGRGAKQGGEKKAKQKRTSGLDAAAQVLADADEPLNAKAIVERMLARGLWQTSGKTPHATIYAAI
ncbi:MAG: hypothetical protein KGY99_11295, partial [Phycisphaerae bacterium]|nr:hypothetical protein [Phycisphaerae bacterium]